MSQSKDKDKRPVRVGMISLGCAKNLVDAEIMLGSLLKHGMEITNDAAKADVVIVNTCSFIDSAQEESVDTILESAELREAKNRGQGLIVSGCLPQRFREELPKLLPEVDAFMGIDQVAQVGDIVKQAMEHRKTRVHPPSPELLRRTRSPKSKAQSQQTGVKSKKSVVVGKLGELQKILPNGDHDAAENIRGTAKFGKTRTVAAPPAMNVNLKFGSTKGVFSAACTGGDGNLNCWPTTKVVVGEICDLIHNLGHMHDKDYIAVDDSNSVAKGSVYVVWTRFSCNSADNSVQILLSKCTNSLSTCTAPFTLESTTGTGGSIDFLQLSHITVSPVNGKVYVTWNKFFAPLGALDPPAVVTDTIRMRVITPTSLTTSVGTAGPLRTVTTEAQPIPFSTFPYPGLFRIATYPHVGVMGGRAIVVWDRRTTKSLLFDTYFFDSDILARFTDNDGASFSADQVVSSAPSFQYQPSICVSPASSRVVVSYFSSQNDLVSKHRQDEYVATSTTGAAPYTPLRVTPVSNVTENNPILGDSFIGDYQEAACGTNFAYLHYTANYTAKSDAPFDSTPVIIPQQDNFLAKVTLP